MSGERSGGGSGSCSYERVMGRPILWCVLIVSYVYFIYWLLLAVACASSSCPCRQSAAAEAGGRKASGHSCYLPLTTADAAADALTTLLLVAWTISHQWHVRVSCLLQGLLCKAAAAAAHRVPANPPPLSAQRRRIKLWPSLPRLTGLV